jgi:hypothetical protein
MDFDYTAYEYLPECTDGCGAITGWLVSKQVAREAGENHARETGHNWKVLEKMKEGQAARRGSSGPFLNPASNMHCRENCSLACCKAHLAC